MPTAHRRPAFLASLGTIDLSSPRTSTPSMHAGGEWPYCSQISIVSPSTTIRPSSVISPSCSRTSEPTALTMVGVVTMVVEEATALPPEGVLPSSVQAVVIAASTTRTRIRRLSALTIAPRPGFRRAASLCGVSRRVSAWSKVCREGPDGRASRQNRRSQRCSGLDGRFEAISKSAGSLPGLAGPGPDRLAEHGQRANTKATFAAGPRSERSSKAARPRRGRRAQSRAQSSVIRVGLDGTRWCGRVSTRRKSEHRNRWSGCRKPRRSGAFGRAAPTGFEPVPPP